MGQIMGNLEAGGGGPYQFCRVFKSGGTGGAPVWCGEVGLVSDHEEVDSRGPHVFLRKVTGKRARRHWDGTWWW